MYGAWYRMALGDTISQEFSRNGETSVPHVMFNDFGLSDSFRDVNLRVYSIDIRMYNRGLVQDQCEQSAVLK